VVAMVVAMAVAMVVAKEAAGCPGNRGDLVAECTVDHYVFYYALVLLNPAA